MHFDQIASRYDNGRASPLEDGFQRWRQELGNYVGDEASVLDVGVGTGLYAEALSRWFCARVTGVDPSARMLERGRGARPRGRTHLVRGVAEALPFKTATFDVAWLSHVTHHLVDLPASLSEVARVVRPSGVILIRGIFPGREDQVRMLKYFPEASLIINSSPSIRVLCEALATHRWQLAADKMVGQVTAPTLEVYLARLKRRADSTLTRLPDWAYHQGMARLAREVYGRTSSDPVVDHLTLLAFKHESDGGATPNVRRLCSCDVGRGEGCDCSDYWGAKGQ